MPFAHDAPNPFFENGTNNILYGQEAKHFSVDKCKFTHHEREKKHLTLRIGQHLNLLFVRTCISNE